MDGGHGSLAWQCPALVIETIFPDLCPFLAEQPKAAVRVEVCRQGTGVCRNSTACVVS